MRVTGHYPRYCQFCGYDRLEHMAPESAFTCVNCCRTSYMNSKPSVCAVIIHDGKVLLVKCDDSRDGGWDLPGGFLLYGEVPQSGLKRELREELNVDIEVGELLDAVVDTYGESSEYSLNLYYATTLASQSLKVGAEVIQFGWFDLRKLPLLQFESTREVLSRFSAK